MQKSKKSSRSMQQAGCDCCLLHVVLLLVPKRQLNFASLHVIISRKMKLFTGLMTINF
jgi:hypothetical protein